ncbi:MAG: aspartate-semialdehyde dehydrogenase [Candidatus Acidiferrales bacterium]
MAPRKIRAAILGATGTVGQRFLQLLENHPQFEVTALAASDRSQGKTYAQACTWRLPGEIPAIARALPVEAPEPPLDCDFVFSSLPSDSARDVEEKFARAGYPVVSNSAAWRMDSDVPLLIPEINPGHLALIEAQRRNRGFGRGYLVTNPNCSTIILALALAPLEAEFGIESVTATTLQALSGAGYPGVASLDIADNVMPYIAQEEEKMEREVRKILGKVSASVSGMTIAGAPLRISAQCHRVDVTDGHMVATRVKLSRPGTIDNVRRAMENFVGLPQELKLRTAPARPVLVRSEKDRPQPRLDRDAGGGMSVTVGRLFPDNVLDYRFVVLGHNTIRGAAGAAILNAELLLAQGLLESAAPSGASAAQVAGSKERR